MRDIIKIANDRVVPSISAVLRSQGIPKNVTPEQKITNLAEEAIRLYKELAEPQAVWKEISIVEFDSIYRGEGNNESETPLGDIYTESSRLALFAVTIGHQICREISRLFEDNDFALGAMLDSAASEGTEMTAQALEDQYRSYLRANNRLADDSAVLRFSPGYCGWHLSGQKKLFGFLEPEKIGIELGASFLMNPLKSISGVLVAGPKEIFDFEAAFPFCSDCESFSCRDRFDEIIRK